MTQVAKRVYTLGKLTDFSSAAVTAFSFDRLFYANSNWNWRPVFRAKNPAATAQWYKENLGIELVPTDYGQNPWSQEAGPTVFAPFPEDTAYFGDVTRQWMINSRVNDLDAMVEQLRAAKIDVSVNPEKYPNGRFARLLDPEGNPIELWEPE